MAETVNRGNIIVLNLFSVDCALNNLVDLSIVRVCKEYRLKVSVLISYVNHTVFLFILTGKLVFLDFTCHIVLYVCANNKTVLGSAVHSLSVNIVVLF